MINQQAVLPIVAVEQEQRLFTFALWLSFATIGYNIIEGIVSVVFAVHDETLTLFGFGVDSFIEVLSGIGIAHMIMRIRNNPQSNRDDFEITALKITGFSFYTLVVGLAFMVVYNIVLEAKPTTTFSGIVISVVSIVSMWLLIRFKMDVGTKLNSQPIIADAHCTRVCLMMSFVLLATSLLFELTHIPYIDALGTLGVVWYALSEGKECFEKAKNKSCSCSC